MCDVISYLFSLKKNKNKTDETSRMLERRINSLNSSIAALSEEVSQCCIHGSHITLQNQQRDNIGPVI